jgi:transcriptional regulator with XRE-family HTH domain
MWSFKMKKINKILKARLENGLTQAQLAEDANITIVALSRIENGHTVKPQESTLRCIAAALNCMVEDLKGE